MPRLFALLLAVAMTGPAHAAPFDHFELIMWQDQTPAATASLKALGFTGLKLTASGGRIDPTRLAALRAGGLPWYLENIATDFLSPYHRYTAGKPVTWLFDQAKDRLRANPDDTSVFLREPGLSDPAAVTAATHRLRAIVQAQRGDHPLFYNLADEAGIGDLAAAWDADIAPTSLAAMRAWLRTRYTDLTALNTQWDTRFNTWDEVMPELTDTALRRTDDNYSAWADFKAWMDVAFARAVRAGTDAVHEVDGQALAGLEGAQTPGWGGYDYSLLAPAVDVMEVYDYGNAADLARAFNPRLVLLRTGFGEGPREAHATWQHVLRGGRGTIVWDDAQTVVKPDGQIGPRGRALAALNAAIRAVAPVLLTATPVSDPVAVLVSQASFRTRWMLDQRTRSTPWWARDAAREYEDNPWSVSRRQILRQLDELGIAPRLLSSAMLEDGALRRDAPRVLILPHAIALSAGEIAAIRAFKQAGGQVIADTEPGLFDDHSRRRPTGMADGLAVVPEALLNTGDIGDPTKLAAIAALLRDAGVIPRAAFIGPDGLAATGVRARWLHQGTTMILALQTVNPWSGPPRLEVRLSAPAVVSPLNGRGSERPVQRVPVQLDPITPTLLRIKN